MQKPELPISKNEIIQAHKTIEEYIHYTSVLTCGSIDDMFDCSIYFKCENFQKAGSFKSRGASNAVLQQLQLLKQTGVATHSSGNHAQALARIAKYTKVMSQIVMPENSNPLKIAAVKEYGGEITFCEPTLKSREETLQQIIRQTAAVEIHPYNDLLVIAGQATVAKEMFEQMPQAHIVIAPLGGGGLLSGTILAASYFAPNTKIIGVEPIQADDASRSFVSKTFVPSLNPQTIADGLKTSLGSLTYPIIINHVHDILTVSENSIIDAIKLIWLRMKIIVEPSSAVVLAAIMEHPHVFKGKTVGAIISGGNADIYNLPWYE
jgi:threonine dehydratase